jgi:hypothetical protein
MNYLKQPKWVSGIPEIEDLVFLPIFKQARYYHREAYLLDKFEFTINQYARGKDKPDYIGSWTLSGLRYFTIYLKQNYLSFGLTHNICIDIDMDTYLKILAPYQLLASL